MQLSDFTSASRRAGATAHQERLLLRAWLAAQPLVELARGRRAPFGKRLLARVPELERELDRIARIDSRIDSSDASSRLLIELGDGKTIETVLLPKGALCVSTQIGCAVGCRFCKTGEDGLARNLSSLEILAQVALARRIRPVRRVVLMGMGEPSHNLAAVLEALEWLGSEGAVAHKRIVFSTVGDRKCFDRLLANGVRPALALSLHSSDDAKRAELLPRAPRVPVRDLVELADDYARSITWPVLYQWTLLEGVNDSDDELAGAIELLRERHGMLNLIGWNPIEGFPFARTRRERALEWVRELRRHRIIATLRDSAGRDVEAGCGQLRSRAATAQSGP
jgi:23S rRNA (adenine2503-C2)-methyltransferase